MRRILIMGARILGPILITKLMRSRKRKRTLPDDHQTDHHIEGNDP